MKPGQLFSHWKQVRKELIWTIDQFGDEELSHVPFENSWPIGEIMLHIASAEEGWFRYVVKGELSDWPDYELDSFRDIESIKMLLNEVHEGTEEFLDGLESVDLERAINLPWSDSQLSLGWIIWHVLEHEIHHRGELSLILGLLGREGLDV
jgi:uncharacterized damage-inducible protein DinB